MSLTPDGGGVGYLTPVSTRVPSPGAERGISGSRLKQRGCWKNGGLFRSEIGVGLDLAHPCSSLRQEALPEDPGADNIFLYSYLNHNISSHAPCFLYGRSEIGIWAK